jgi:diadenosine tetraphosphate (Ap4A) HIT family hydrolase
MITRTLIGVEKILRKYKNLSSKILDLYELKQHKTCFDEECLQFLDQRKQTKMHLLQVPNQNNVENTGNIKRKPSGHFMNKERQYL